MKYATFPKATRVTLIGPNGVEYEAYNLFPDGCELHLQDGGRTVKIWPQQKEEGE